MERAGGETRRRERKSYRPRERKVAALCGARTRGRCPAETTGRGSGEASLGLDDCGATASKGRWARVCDRPASLQHRLAAGRHAVWKGAAATFLWRDVGCL